MNRHRLRKWSVEQRKSHSLVFDNRMEASKKPRKRFFNTESSFVASRKLAFCQNTRRLICQYMVCTTAEQRRNNMAKWQLQNNPPNLTQAYFSTFAGVAANPIGRIQCRPADYPECDKRNAF